MARVTVEDCVEKITNRFELVLIASQRARGLAAGAELTIERDNDKNAVVALREIADETIDLKEVEDTLVQGLQRHVELDEPDEEEMEMLTAEQDLMSEIGGVFASENVADRDLADEDSNKDGEGAVELAGEDTAAKTEASPQDAEEGA